MVTQVLIAEHLDMNQSSVSRLCIALGIDWREASLDQVRTAYIRHLRGVVDDRLAAGDLDLATERAGLARAQREKIEMANAETRSELAPVGLIDQTLSRAADKVSGVFGAVPCAVHHQLPQLTLEDVGLIEAEMAKVCGAVHAMSLADLQDKDSDGDAEVGAPTCQAVLPASTASFGGAL